MRARIHCGLWWTTASAAGRALFHEALDEHWEAWRFVEHAQFIAFMVTTHNLFGNRHGTIRFKKLSEELGGVASDELAAIEPLAIKVRQFRDQLFAHRSDKLTYAQVFARAEITGNDMICVADSAVKIANLMLKARNLPEQPAADLPVAEMGRILAALNQKHEAQGRKENDMGGEFPRHLFD